MERISVEEIADNRAKQIAAAADSIKRNANKIAEELYFNSDLDITISIRHGELPEVIVKRKYIPKEIFDVMNQ